MNNHIPQRGDILADISGDRHMLCLAPDGKWLTIILTGPLAGFASFKADSACVAIESQKLFAVENHN